MTRVLVLSSSDNVAVALDELTPGDTAAWDGGEVVVVDEIPAAHKVAIAPIGVGERVVKYGTPIGLATAPIEPGAHVHVHNVESDRMRGDR
jgi:altronate hydrolase